VPVPFVARRSEAADPEPWTVVVAGQGRTALLADAPRWLADVERPVVVEPRFVGEWQPFADSWRRNGLLLGQGELYQGAHDVALLCHSLPGDAKVTLVGLGEAGPTALCAAALCPRIARLLTDDLGTPYEEAPNRAPLAPELLRFGGLLAFLPAIEGRCQCVLGGAMRGDPRRAGSPRRDLRPPLSADELRTELLPQAR
jgi:hypothetical protein